MAPSSKEVMVNNKIADTIITIKTAMAGQTHKALMPEETNKALLGVAVNKVPMEVEANKDLIVEIKGSPIGCSMDSAAIVKCN